MNAPRAEAALHAALAMEGCHGITMVHDAVRAFAAPLGYDRFVLFRAVAGSDAPGPCACNRVPDHLHMLA